ncbi:MAG TPA: 2OG-Fe(II) oxygenase family protein [Sphingomicrobium sp.]|nr:2OG-Fe(II) oxygenase family protein [Sphingomicrobium sp.]
MRINPNLPTNSLAAELALNRRLQVRDVLASEAADEIHDILATKTPWWLVFNEGDEVRQLSPDVLARLSPQQVEEMLGAVVDRARTQYQFVYAFYPILGNYLADGEPSGPLAKVLEFLNSPAVIDWFRRLTGQSDVRWIDAQATLYQSGHFLKSHSDHDDTNARVAAYVLNFTRLWERDWGGYLQFFDENHDIERAFRPIFNAMNIFLVPTDHSVGIVSPFAYGDRLSITGWLRRDEPPNHFGRTGT